MASITSCSPDCWQFGRCSSWPSCVGAGPATSSASVPFHLCVIGAAAVLILPTAILCRDSRTRSTYIAERMSLGVAVCVCALLGAVQPRVVERYGLMAVAVVFFGFVYRDERALNSFEDRMQDVVSMLPRGRACRQLIQERSAAVEPRGAYDRPRVHREVLQLRELRALDQTVPHSRDRAEPDRGRELQGILSTAKGQYLVKRDDLPLYAVDIDRTGRFQIKLLKAGAVMGATDWSVLDNSPRPSS